MPAGAWKLIIEDDAGKQIVVPFTREIITIGRKEGNTIRLTERNVSRNHAKLSKDNGHVLIEDLGSFNGIRLNGDRIDGRVLVHEGDTIQIGDYHLAIHAQGAAAGAGQNGASDQTQDNAHHGATAPNLGGMAGPRSTAANPAHADDDEFAGDTQRWEPPQGMQGISVQTLPTQEDRAVQSEEPSQPLHATLETQPVRLAPPHNFGVDNGDTERVTLDMLSSIDSMGLDSMKAGAPSRAVREEVELEPTVRQPTAPSLLAPPLSTPSVTVLPATSAGVGSLGNVDRHETRPERTSPTAPRTPPLANVADTRQGMSEQTEAVRPSPSGTEDTLPRLVVLNTIFAGSAFPLRTSEAVIGRTEDNDITIEHKSVSRNHAKIVREGDRVRILDLKSANGVLVNNEEVEAAVLRSGDVVELGRVRMRFVPIGERFTVPPDEIERARIADRAGDDFENDTGTGVTNPVRKKQGLSPGSSGYDTFPAPQSRSKVALLLAIGAALGLLIVVTIIVILNSKDDAVEDPANVEGALDAKADDAKIDDAKVDDAKIDAAKIDDAKLDAKVEDAKITDPIEPAKVVDAKAADAKVEDAKPIDDVRPSDTPDRDPPDRPRAKRQPKPSRMDDDTVEKELDRVQELIGGRPDEARRLFKKVAEARPDHKRVKIFKNFPALK